MKFIFLIILCSSIFLLGCDDERKSNNQVESYSGGVDGGGGIGILCENDLVTLDLYEARLNGLSPAESSKNLEEYLKQFGVEMARHFSEQVINLNDEIAVSNLIYKEMNDSILLKFKDIPKGRRLNLTNDATLPQLPQKCEPVQIAVYAKDGTIYRDSEYWSKLNPIEQAALVIHEWVYFRARSNGSLNSDETRKVIGLIFSGNNPEPIFEKIWSSNLKFWCGAGIEGTDQEVFEIIGVEDIQQGISGLSLYFKVFKGFFQFSRTTAFLPGVSMNQILKSEMNPQIIRVKNQLMNREWFFEILPQSYLGNYKFRASESDPNEVPYSNGFCVLQ